ncbi:ImmA/IrrE family metallo-endopeptidase [Bacillus cytotoxicus]|uniref:IrrE N-terminal-like domain-containing protein n=1 Tax=Bacillus cytotoxicus TaxID=580165 RepID=A0AAX2CP72_9BACI|nr:MULTISPECIES: ImmA/IrrE family metallo-endopeptidase [Bacillus cereus group]QTR81195.1 ImmA/IrrE family metallo-endopeptidase [Bacillus cytotoxicus]SCM08029.1 Uncharacterized protein BCB44BAC_04518 [Bacillus cytotoxicus]
MGYFEKDLANNLVKKHKTNNPYELAYFLNINVVEWDLHPDILGFYKYEQNNKWIILNANASEKEKEITCCHELGHAIMHTRDNTPHLRRNTFFSVGKLEQQANLFAIELLMPDEYWHVYAKEFKTIDAIAHHTKIPEDLLLLKYQKIKGCLI